MAIGVGMNRERWILFTLCLLQATPASNAAENSNERHTKDSEVMLVFIALLVLTIITTFAFRFRSLRYFHETGLAIVYGLIIGAIRRYGGVTDSNSSFSCNSISGNHVNITDEDAYIVNRSDLGALFKCEKPKNVADLMLFDPEVFFNYLLPPIIFYAGYSLKKRHFFRNIGTILAFAFIGTTISTLVISGITFGFIRIAESTGLETYQIEYIDCLTFGALVSATDPVTVLAVFKELKVDVNLDAFLFGESVLNDAVALVLVGTIQHYNNKIVDTELLVDGQRQFNAQAFFASLGEFVGVFLGSFAIGCCVSFVNSLFTKFTKIGHFPVMETGIFFLLSWSAFLIAEAVEFTGIVAVLFCGITQAHYTYNNLSSESKIRTRQLFEVLNFLAENFIFGYMGVAMFVFEHHIWMPLFIVGAFIALVVSRACNIYPLTFLLNLGRKRKIPANIQHMMMFSGLRGAIAFALAIKQTTSDPQKVIFTTTLLIVFVTVWILGGTTTQVLMFLGIKVGVDPDAPDDTAVTNESVRQDTDPVSQTPNTSPVQKYKDSAWMFKRWYKFDKYYLKPFLTHAGPPLTTTLPDCCRPCANCFTTQTAYLSQRNVQDSDSEFILNEDYAAKNESHLMPASPIDSTSSLNAKTDTVGENVAILTGSKVGSNNSPNSNNNHRGETSNFQGGSPTTSASLTVVDVAEGEYPMDQIPL